MGKGSRGRVAWKRKRQKNVKENTHLLQKLHEERRTAAEHSQDKKPGAGMRGSLAQTVKSAKPISERITNRGEMTNDWKDEKDPVVEERDAPLRALKPNGVHTEAEKKVVQDKQTLGELSRTLKKWQSARPPMVFEHATEIIGLLKKINDVELLHYGMSALMRCAKFGFAGGVKYLLEKRGAHPNTIGRSGTALEYAHIGQCSDMRNGTYAATKESLRAFGGTTVNALEIGLGGKFI